MNSPDKLDARNLREILKGVSRSFYLSLRVLPADIRETAGLGYLLARAADTLADTDLVPETERLKNLDTFRRVLRGEEAPTSLHNLGMQSGPHSQLHETTLLHRLPEIVGLFFALPPAHRAVTERVLRTLTDGMVFDLQHFSGTQNATRSLATPADTELYAYQVAGCVGEFWTDLLLLGPLVDRPRPWREAMIRRGVTFGKGLQMINILRDLPKDLARGRCYLSQEKLRQFHLTLSDLAAITSGQDVLRKTLEQFEALYRDQITLARAWLAEGLAYTLALPRLSVRLRLAVLWPLFIGLSTLRLLDRRLSSQRFSQGLRISRAQVYRILTKTGLAAWHNGCLRRLYLAQGGLP